MPRVGAHLLDQVEPVERGQDEVHDHAVERLALERLERLLARRHRHGLHVAGVVVGHERGDAAPLRGVVLDEQEAPHLAIEEGLHVREGAVEGLLRHRLLEVGERAQVGAAPLGVDDADDVHRDVARARVALEPVEHLPAVDDGQLDVERDGVGLELVGERQAGVAAVGDDHLEAALARQAHEDAGELHVVLDDEQHAVARAQVLAVVLERRRQAERRPTTGPTSAPPDRAARSTGSDGGSISPS